MSYDAILSYVSTQKPLRLVYSLLASYGAQRGGALPGSWFVAALEPFGHRPASIRQTLYRMVREGALVTEPVGPHKLYRLSTIGRASTDAGTDRLRTVPPAEWDGRWTVVAYEFASDQRGLREMVRGLLDVEGFAAISRGTLVHPRDRTARLATVLAEEHAEANVHVFRADRVAHEPDRALITRLWDLDGIRRGYESFISTFGPLARRRRWDRVGLEHAVATRFALVISFLETAWRDPQIPGAPLPPDWPAARAQALAATLQDRLREPLMEYGDDVLHSLPRPIRLDPAA